MSTQLSDRIALVLEQSPHVPHRSMRFEASEGQVTLRGVVRTWYEKQMAQEVLRGLEGVKGIQNQLEVSHSTPLFSIGMSPSAELSVESPA